VTIWKAEMLPKVLPSPSSFTLIYCEPNESLRDACDDAFPKAEDARKMVQLLTEIRQSNPAAV
jgi:hypothetical protein